MKRLTLLLLALFASTLSFAQIKVAAEQIERYLPLLEGKRVGVVANQSSLVGDVHLIDTLVALGVDIEYVFAPEHGFRGKAAAGAHIEDEVDSKTGIKIYSLYGTTKSPSRESLECVDVLLFDLQDVGVRYYTYISTLYYIMSQGAKYDKSVIVLDRPNPNIHYVDGPILDMKYRSFVGMYPIPIVYGMTIGELAEMANAEGWLEEGLSCNLTVIPVEGYSRRSTYHLPVAPSPNLPNYRSLMLYPSLCYFEATTVSVGRNTPYPFQQYGSPDIKGYDYSFTPELKGAKLHYGVLLTSIPWAELKQQRVSLKYLLDAYERMGRPANFLNSFFEKLIGVGYVREMIEEGKSASEIESMWREDVENFKVKREKYLIYK